MTASGGASFPASLVLVGAGKMGGALLQGWLDLGLEPRRIRLIEPQPAPKILALCAERGVALAPPTAAPEVLVLAVKPQMLDAVAPQLAAFTGEATLVVSILAGKTMTNILDRLPQARAVVRAMPNLAAAIGQGMTGAVANAAVTPGAAAKSRCASRGRRRRRMARRRGAYRCLDRDLRLRPRLCLLSRRMPRRGRARHRPAASYGGAFGAGDGRRRRRAFGAMADQSPAALRESVTSRGGVTAAALDVLMGAEGLKPLHRKSRARREKASRRAVRMTAFLS